MTYEIEFPSPTDPSVIHAPDEPKAGHFYMDHDGMIWVPPEYETDGVVGKHYLAGEECAIILKNIAEPIGVKGIGWMAGIDENYQKKIWGAIETFPGSLSMIRDSQPITDIHVMFGKEEMITFIGIEIVIPEISELMTEGICHTEDALIPIIFTARDDPKLKKTEPTSEPAVPPSVDLA